MVRDGRKFVSCGRWRLRRLACRLAPAHLERPSYWPDPTPDHGRRRPGRRQGSQGAIARLRRHRRQGPGQVRVVCQEILDERSPRSSIRKARNKGFRLRPSQPKKKLSDSKASKLLRSTSSSFDKCCRLGSIQKAINKSGNNDRVVVMPGLYTEPKSRKAPANDPKCNPDRSAGPDRKRERRSANTPSYEYQATCPNDQNLIYVQGRTVEGDPLATPRTRIATASPSRSSARASSATCRSRARARGPKT